MNTTAPSEHAEDNGMNNVIRLNRYKKILSKGESIDIFVIRISKTGVIGLSRPCRNCIKRLSKCPFPIGNVYYSIDSNRIAREKFINMFQNIEQAILSTGDRSRLIIKSSRSRSYESLKRRKKSKKSKSKTRREQYYNRHQRLK